MPDATFVLYARRDCSFVPPSSRWSIRCDKHSIFSRLPVPYWIRYRAVTLVKLDSIDVFWTPNTIIPAGLSDVVPCVITVHDFRHVLEPGNLPPIIRHAYRKWVGGDVRCAAKVVTNSAGTSVRMQALLGRSADAVALPSVPSLPATTDSVSASKMLLALGIRQPFLLTVGSSPCKNLGKVVDAVGLLKAQGRLPDHHVVMVGKETWSTRRAEAARSQAIDWVRPLGYVDDTTMAALYSLADALVFPSSYEGFGMPVYEARSMGCRVVTTDSPELREAGGTDATYVDPTPEGIAIGLESALSRAPPRMHRLEHDWGDAAEAMATVFRRAITT